MAVGKQTLEKVIFEKHKQVNVSLANQYEEMVVVDGRLVPESKAHGDSIKS